MGTYIENEHINITVYIYNIFIQYIYIHTDDIPRNPVYNYIITCVCASVCTCIINVCADAYELPSKSIALA